MKKFTEGNRVRTTTRPGTMLDGLMGTVTRANYIARASDAPWDKGIEWVRVDLDPDNYGGGKDVPFHPHELKLVGAGRPPAEHPAKPAAAPATDEPGEGSQAHDG